MPFAFLLLNFCNLALVAVPVDCDYSGLAVDAIDPDFFILDVLLVYDGIHRESALRVVVGVHQDHGQAIQSFVAFLLLVQDAGAEARDGEPLLGLLNSNFDLFVEVEADRGDEFIDIGLSG